ncbi:DUF1801 domain-containing protein [Neolewinella agarilytica]|uniref:YdhG-like domain-containing protein n=1 Tax=Neolewinella agarilytica TaxID=478744 RepID=A0A1H9ASU4_9BACT|nr:DUF1801 domain-containing protein [Neolewinella agarilytica]SEP79605.1 protein of unknown function (DU1801) [Neolewinella agarilytica]
MNNLTIKQDPRMEAKFQSYAEDIRANLLHLRSLIMEVAREEDSITSIEETLKWGEPSYLAKKGSTIRIDWKAKTPDQYAIYFKCTSKLVETFREVYGDIFQYENNRAILFKMGQKVPEKELKDCIHMALRYHELKHLPRLGIEK